MAFSTSLTNHLLIAMPGLQDPNFARTVTYICEHSEHGAMGIVINRPLEVRLGALLNQLEIPVQHPGVDAIPIYQGGPVQTDRGFVLHTAGYNYDSTLNITPDISVTTSRDILEAIARGEGPDQVLIALGYAGWGSGQLEWEMSANAWLNGPASNEIIFRLKPSARWMAAAQLLGVDLNLMSGEAGHA
ncbi:MAG: YqgE/AlgH family protein [Thermochromatium sp.]